MKPSTGTPALGHPWPWPPNGPSPAHTRQVRSERQVAVRAQRARGTVTLRGRDYAPSHAAAAAVALANLARALLSALKTPRAPLRTHADVMRCA